MSFIKSETPADLKSMPASRNSTLSNPQGASTSRNMSAFTPAGDGSDQDVVVLNTRVSIGLQIDYEHLSPTIDKLSDDVLNILSDLGREIKI